MENAYAVRITFPYVNTEQPRQCVQNIVAAWSTHVQRMVVYEHDDDGANHIHCHIMIEGSRISKKRLQQLAATAAPLRVVNPGGRALSLMSFRSKEYDGNVAGFAYVTKGKYDPKYLQGWSVEETERWKAAWVTPAEHFKRTPWRILMDSFMEWSNDKPNRLDYDQNITTPLVCNRVRRFLLAKHQGLYPPQAKTERWFLVTNLCLQYQLPFPEYWKE